MTNDPSAPAYEVLNPRAAPPAMPRFPLSDRAATLSGKKIYVIDMHIEGTYIFMEKVAELIAERLPDAHIVFKTKPSVYSSDDPELWDEVAEHADAFIFGPGAATSGFTFGAFWSITLEKMGISGVFVLSDGYEHAVDQTCIRNGMPQLRRVVTPSPPWGDETLFQHMPRIIEEIMAGLTEPLTEDEKRTGDISPPTSPRVAMKGSLAEVNDYFVQNRWADGLPIIPPTEKNVADMLAGTSHSPDKIITEVMPPLEWAVTVEKVAVNGVMAGCKPETMPVLLAMVEAFATGSFVASVVSANSFCFMVLVNGPMAEKIGMNSGINALGPGNPANASIGRALRLFVTNLGGIAPGATLMACQGNNSNYSFAFAENENASPWEPFHVSMGFKPEENAVTIMAGGWGHGGNGAGRRDEPVNLDNIVEIIRTFQLPWGAAILISPLLARNITSEKGFTKQDLKDYLQKNTTKTAREFRSDPYFNTFIEPVLRGKKIYSFDHIWPDGYLEADDDKHIPIYGQSEFIYPIVVGGEAYSVFQAWKMAFPSTVSIDKWV